MMHRKKTTKEYRELGKKTFQVHRLWVYVVTLFLVLVVTEICSFYAYFRATTQTLDTPPTLGPDTTFEKLTAIEKRVQQIEETVQSRIEQ